ncbi:MAG: hypothetical protein AAB227_05630 [Pseudomonadota bacterium]
MATLFDTYVIIDWSAANTPRFGKDSIWICEVLNLDPKLCDQSPLNIGTRSEAMNWLTAFLRTQIRSGRKAFVGFDFPFGFPAGVASKIAGNAKWDALWAFLHDGIRDDIDGKPNRSNRYEFANTLNRDVFGEPVFWGRPYQHSYSHLPAKKDPSKFRAAMEFRITEKRFRPAKPVWQLAYNGAVGSQALLGIARLEALRRQFNSCLAIWPFETSFAENLSAPIIIAEIYPSLLDVQPDDGEVKDRAQVRLLARRFAELDASGELLNRMSRPREVGADDHNRILLEEGWIVSP